MSSTAVRCLRVKTPEKDLDRLEIDYVPINEFDGDHVDEIPLQPHQLLVKVHAIGVNNSDVGATMGYFDHALFPRVVGRDFAGTVVAQRQRCKAMRRDAVDGCVCMYVCMCVCASCFMMTLFMHTEV